MGRIKANICQSNLGQYIGEMSNITGSHYDSLDIKNDTYLIFEKSIIRFINCQNFLFIPICDLNADNTLEIIDFFEELESGILYLLNDITLGKKLPENRKGNNINQYLVFTNESCALIVSQSIEIISEDIRSWTQFEFLNKLISNGKKEI